MCNNEICDVTPLICPVCDSLLRSLDDEKSYRDFLCCDACSLRWARSNKEKWELGWRPSKDLVEAWLQETQTRIFINI